jgi:hypothetical protein
MDKAINDAKELLISLLGVELEKHLDNCDLRIKDKEQLARARSQYEVEYSTKVNAIRAL